MSWYVVIFAISTFSCDCQENHDKASQKKEEVNETIKEMNKKFAELEAEKKETGKVHKKIWT